MAITHWYPFRDLFGLHTTMQSLLQEYARQAGSRGDADALTQSAFVPPTDIFEDQNQIVLTLEIPGLKQDDFDISVENSVLSVRGQRQWASEQKEESYQRVERRYGSFNRSFALPQSVDHQEVHASYEAGILRIELKKRPELKSRKIAVQIGRSQQQVPSTVEAT